MVCEKTWVFNRSFWKPTFHLKYHLKVCRSMLPGLQSKILTFEPHHEKTGLWGFQPDSTQTGLYSLRKRLETGNFGFKTKRGCTI